MPAGARTYDHLPCLCDPFHTFSSKLCCNSINTSEGNSCDQAHCKRPCLPSRYGGHARYQLRETRCTSSINYYGLHSSSFTLPVIFYKIHVLLGKTWKYTYKGTNIHKRNVLWGLAGGCRGPVHYFSITIFREDIKILRGTPLQEKSFMGGMMGTISLCPTEIQGFYCVRYIVSDIFCFWFDFLIILRWIL